MTAEDAEAVDAIAGPVVLLILAGVAGLITAAVLAVGWVSQQMVYDKCKSGTSLIVGNAIYKCQKVGDL